MNSFKLNLKTINTIAVISAVMTISACHHDKKYEVRPTQDFDGIWQSEIQGDLYAIKNDKVQQYQLSKTGCLVGFTSELSKKDGNYYAYTNRKLVKVDANTVNISSDFGSQSIYKKINSVPTSCGQPITNTPENNFEVFWHTFNDHYAFFDIYKVDWQAMYTKYRPQVNSATTDEQLREIFMAMIQPLDDAHITLNIPKEKNTLTLSPATSKAWEAKSGDFFTKILVPSLQKIEGVKHVQYPIVSLKSNPNIRAFIIPTFDEDSINNDKFIKDIETLVNEAKKSNVQAIVLDLRFNSGGSEAYAAILASYFTNKKVPYAKASYWYKDKFTDEVDLVLNPHPSAITNKPVYVLTSSVTASAAEAFTLMMREMPNVTIVGDNTKGVFSDILSKSLPNGWEIGLSNQRYRNMNNINFEGGGIPADVKFEITLNDINAKKDVMMEYVLADVAKK